MRALAVAVLLALPAGADVELGGRPGLRLGAGYDDNLFLDAQPSGPNPQQIRADAVFDVQPHLLGWLESRRHLLTLNADYLERLTPSTGDLRDAELSLGWYSPRWGPISFSLAARYERWAASVYPQDTFDLGGADAGVRFQLHERVALELLYRFAARAYSDSSRAGQLDLDQRARAGLRVRAADWLQLQAAYTFADIDSQSGNPLLSDGAKMQRHRGDLSLEITPLPWLVLSAGYAVAAQHLPSAVISPGNGPDKPRDDLLQWLDLAVTARPLPWLELFAHYQLLDSTSTDPSGTYRRNQVLAGAGVRWDFIGQVRPLLPRIAAHSVTFRHRAAPSRRVEVVGDWSGWQPQPLVERSHGLYEATYIVPSGRHEYAFRVDGEPAEPADARAYVPDGFGGKSAVVDVE